jgi:hypothetical protein
VPRRLRPLVLAAAVAILAAAVPACSGDDGASPTATTATTGTPGPTIDKTRWAAYNERRTGYTDEANAIAKQVAERINTGGLRCRDYSLYSFDAIAPSYRAAGLPLALGAGQCDVLDENVLIEVFGTEPPTAEDFVAAKRELLCRRARELGRKPDGTNDFDGIPYVMAPDKTWIAEPDSIAMGRRIGRALGLPAGDMCAGIT